MAVRGVARAAIFDGQGGVRMLPDLGGESAAMNINDGGVVEVRSYSDDNAGGHVVNHGRFTLIATY